MKTGLRCLWLLLLLHTQALSASEPKFMLLVPSLLHGGSSEQVCIIILNLNETIHLNVVLETSKENVTLINRNQEEPNAFECTPFEFTNPKESEVAYITLHGKGESLEFKGKRSVLLQSLKTLVFLQTDKHIYKPGQTIQFRVVALNEQFIPVKETFPLIYIMDPQQNRVNQWRDVKTDGGIIDLTFPLAPEPSQGSYKVVVERTGDSRVDHIFKVEEYVLPKFEVLVQMAKTITILEEHLTVKACALYTYGKPVTGTISVDVCRRFSNSYYNCGPGSQEVCESFAGQADSHGCLSEEIKTKAFHLQRSGYEMNIKAKAKVTEEGTGVELMGEGSSSVTSTMAKVTFVEVGSIYKPGIPIFGQVKLEDAANAPMPNETITISVAGKKLNYTTDQNGLASFSINTSKIASARLQLSATYRESEYCGSHQWLIPSYQTAHHQVKRVRSRSQSYLSLEPKTTTLKCNKEELITVHYILTPEAVEDAEEIKLYLLVMAKGGIAVKLTKVLKMEEKGTASGTIAIALTISSALAPNTNMLIFSILPNGEVIADKTSFKVEMCFDNKVKLDFSANVGHPASNVNLLLEAAPKSLCALNIVDKSVLVMAPGKELTAEKIYNLLPVQDLSGYHHEQHDLEEAREDPCVSAEPIILNGLYYSASARDDDTNAYDLLKAMGLKVWTNAQVRTPVPCVYADVDEVAYTAASVGMRYHAEALEMDDHQIPPPMSETVRKYFPETWIWDLMLVDSAGKRVVPLTIPDTITEWKAGMFCTAEDVGFGLSAMASLTAFQPFFLDLTLPYSVVRGEAFTLKATVFNYLDKCINVQITLQDSPDFQAEHAAGSTDAQCLCANEQKTISWTVTPKSLGELNFTVSAEALQEKGLCGNQIATDLDQGRKDTVIKPLLVEPEGVEQEVTHNAMACVGETSAAAELISLVLPKEIVEGSARAYFSVLGDIMGTATQNLDKLLQMPFGCGEQNMVLFTPNIYILEYLNQTGQLTEDIKSKAIGYLRSGYQRQLTYMHYDGSCSTFGLRSGQGNTWLTAFVLKSFARARSHIFIDEQQLSKALQWLSGRQKDNGCFQSVGKLFNNAMKGGVDDEITLSAYIAIALLEYPLPVHHPVVRNALFCLETASKSLDNVYAKALVSYAFALAGKENQAEQLLTSLEAEAVSEEDGASIHWERTKKPKEDTDRPFYYHRAPSAEVEMTSYVLLAMLQKTSMSLKDLSKASKIVKWITKQQNPNGGFSSTQDTVVALQALSVYGAATYVKNSELQVTVTSTGQFKTEFTVDDGNRLLLQRNALPNIPGTYTAFIKGKGCVYMQATHRYNIPHPTGDSPFHLAVSTSHDTCQRISRKIFDITVNASYVGPRQTSNMALVDVKMVSGYIPVKSSTAHLRNNPLVERVEVKPNHLIIYLEHLTNATVSLSFSVEEETTVMNLKPATVRVYDYYETDDFQITEYSAPCSAEKTNA